MLSWSNAELPLCPGLNLELASAIGPFHRLNEPRLQNIYLAPHLGFSPPPKSLTKEKHSLVCAGDVASYKNDIPGWRKTFFSRNSSKAFGLCRPDRALLCCHCFCFYLSWILVFIGIFSPLIDFEHSSSL